MNVGVQGSSPLLKSYASGILSSTACGTKIDHAVVIVGYSISTTQNGVSYYIVRNSWGADWGENGYARILIADGAGTCGIQIQVGYPLFK